MQIGIIILNYNDYTTTIQLLDRIKSYKSLKRIVIVDNNSTDNSFQKISEYIDSSNIHLMSAEKNGGYSYGNNLGLRYLIEHENVDIAIIANPDVIFEEDILDKIEEYLANNPSCGLVSPVMKDKNGNDMRMWLKLPVFINSIFDCFFIGRQLNKLIRKTNVDKTIKTQKVEILPGSFLAFRSSALKKINYLDENVFLYYEENIIGERLKAVGEETVLLNVCSYIHNHSVTIKKNLSILKAFKCNLKSKLYYEKTYHKISKTQEFWLKAMIRYAVFEMSIILKLRSFFRI